MTTKEISDAYEVFQNLDVFDLSKEGEEALSAALRQYEQAIDAVESTITTKLRDSLGSATSAKEMFRIFGRFNKLFSRPRIKGAIQEYQTQLVRTVQKDIQMLQEKFKNKYQNSQNSVLARVRDIPLTAGYVIWAGQLKAKLRKYMAKVEQVLGSHWAEDPDGKRCKEIGETFEKILDVTKVVSDWNLDITKYKKNLE